MERLTFSNAASLGSHDDLPTIFFLRLSHSLIKIIVIFCLFLSPLPLLASQSEKQLTVGFLVGISGLGDQSFNDMAYAGLMKAKQENNLRIIYEDSEKSEQAFDSAMVRLLDKNADIIIANGFYMKPLVEKYARIHPERFFIIQDAVIQDLPNVVCVLYSVEEGSFLAGALAGMISTSGQVGFIGGVDIPIMHVFRLGFQEGLKHTRPDAELSAKFLSIAPDYSGFKKPAAGYNTALKLYDTGVDIIFAAAGLSGNGVLQAAKKSGKLAIGVDSDQDHLAQGHVLTSMMKRLDRAIYNEVSKIVKGKFAPGIVKYGLKEQGVGLSSMKFTSHLVSKKSFNRLREIEQEIISGSIQVPNFLETAKTTQ